MAKRSTPEIRIEMEAIVRLQPTRPVSRAELELATMEVERALEEHTVDLADGASASANFKDGVIEIDLRLEGCSAGELHQQVALIVMQLDQHCTLRIAPLGTAPRRRHQQPGMPPVEVRSTVAQLVSA